MHNMVLGMTGCGKSSLFKIYAKDLTAKGKTVIVMDPMGDDWEATKVYHNKSFFQADIKKYPNSFFIVDESASVVDRYRDDLWWLATQSRHRGMLGTFIAQYPAQIPPAVRGQCSVLYCFRVGKKTAKDLAEEWSCDALLDCAELPRLHFIRCDRFGTISRGKVDPVHGKMDIFDSEQKTKKSLEKVDNATSTENTEGI